MKVTVGNDTYLMHWKRRKFSPKYGKNTERELEATDCIIRLISDTFPDPVEIARGHVGQTSCDPDNRVTARNLSFRKAIKDLVRPLRKALGDEYNRTCRMVSETASQKNRKLRKRVSALQRALTMANSMILSGEQHSEQSKKEINSALV